MTPRPTPAPQPRRSRAQWRQLLLDQRRSGATPEDFAHDHGILAQRLRWWAWKLRAELDTRPIELVPIHTATAMDIDAEITIGDLTLRVRTTSPTAIAQLIRELRTSC